MCNPHNSAMKRFTLIVLTVAFLSMTHIETASAQDSQPSGFGAVFQKLNPANWKAPSFQMPSFLVPQEDKTRIVERKDGLVADIKGTASRSWTRTRETLNPARLNPMNLFAGTGDTAGTATGESKPGFFSSLLSPPATEPAERVASVNEFLGQERP
ncbi:hypothetical protein SAMN06265222_104121 [Neorhodopirellula lusitana]|uniref:Uncharacterized protein n=2 Tax=Neorhodopirellula lusitana TaxID=445327 RepID=A0ABY1Q1H3_9BACT|nr:hypothetical protein SAMN06265222_104121 [Neorhodopirellula lusitana]